MDIKFDGNRGMENPKTRKPTFIIFTIVVIVGLLLIGIVWYEGHNGKNASSPILTITSRDSVKKDTTTINIDNHKEVNIKENNAPIILK